MRKRNFETNDSKASKRARIEEKGCEMMYDGKWIFTNYSSLSPTDTEGKISFNELLSPKDHLTGAIVSTFVVDIEWLTECFPRTIPLIIVKQWDKNEESPGIFSSSIRENLKFVHPKVLFFGVVHAKYMILNFSSFLRVVITSANMGPLDWDLLGQVVWVQDFPLRTDNEDCSCEFSRDISMFNEKIGIPKTLFESTVHLSEFDLRSAVVKLVASIPGYHKGDDMKKYGHLRLKELFNSVASSHDSRRDSEVIYQTSSLGRLDRGFVKQFIESIGGIFDGLDEEQFPSFKVLFPTKDHVLSKNPGGLFAASTMCLREEFWKMSTFPRNWFCNVPSTWNESSNLLLHSKVIMRINRDNDSMFVYFGSHNFSPSAWGRLQKDETQLHVANYELGVVFPQLSVENIGILPFEFPILPFEDSKGQIRQNYDPNRDDPYLI